LPEPNCDHLVGIFSVIRSHECSGRVVGESMNRPVRPAGTNLPKLEGDVLESVRTLFQTSVRWSCIPLQVRGRGSAP